MALPLLNLGTISGACILLANAIIALLQRNKASLDGLPSILSTWDSTSHVTVLIGVVLIMIGAASTLTRLKSQYSKDHYAVKNANYHRFSPAFATYHHRGEAISNIVGTE